MLRNEETLQKAIECACHRLADSASRQQILERIIAELMAERPDLAQDSEALANEALNRLPDYIRHIAEQ